MSPSSKLSMFTVRESATSPVHRMNHSARLCAVPTRRQIRPRTRRRPPQSCLCRERGTPAMQSALSSETFPLSASARQCITMRQVDLRVTCSGPDTLASRHPLWTGLVGSTASSCIPSSGHANPDGWHASKNHLATPSVRVSSGTVSAPPARPMQLAVRIVVTSTDVCGVSTCCRTLSAFSNFYVWISSHKHPQRTLTSQVLHTIANL